MADKKCSVDGALNKGPWQPEEDLLLKKYVEANGAGRWTTLASKAGLKRCGKSCRLRWMNYLRPNVKRGHITPDEADLIIRLHKLLGNRWSLIAARVPGRTDNDVKNFWNIHLSKKSGRKGVHLKIINSKLKDTTFPNTNSIGDSTKDEMESKCSTNLNLVPRRLSLERDSILGQSELRMLQNPCISSPDGQYPCSDESTKPSDALLLQHLIAPSSCNINPPSCNVSYADSDELYSVVYKFPSPLTTLVQQNSRGLQSEISDTMQGLPITNQYHPHSDSFGLISFLSGFDSNYISNFSSCLTNQQPNNLSSQFEYPNSKAESDRFNSFLDEVTKLKNGVFPQTVIAAAAENPNLSTAPYTLCSAQKDEFYRIPSPLTTLVQQNSHGLQSDIKQGLTTSNQYHSHSDAFGSAFVPGFDSNYIFDSARSFTNLQPNNLNS